MKNFTFLALLLISFACGEQKPAMHDFYHETHLEYEGIDIPPLTTEESLKSIMLCNNEDPENPFNYEQNEFYLKGTWLRRTKEKIYQEFDFYVLLQKVISPAGQRKVKLTMLDSTKKTVDNNLLQVRYDFTEERDGYQGFLTVSLGQPSDIDPNVSPILMTHIQCDLHQGEGLIQKSNADKQLQFLSCYQTEAFEYTLVVNYDFIQDENDNNWAKQEFNRGIKEDQRKALQDRIAEATINYSISPKADKKLVQKQVDAWGKWLLMHAIFSPEKAQELDTAIVNRFCSLDNAVVNDTLEASEILYTITLPAQN